MTENRQALADSVLGKGTLGLGVRTRLRAWARLIAYATPFLRRLVETRKATAENAARWNALMSGTAHATYLGGTINVDSCNSLTGTLIKYRACQHPAVLDIGCCGGTLMSYLPPYKRYLGLDISDYAIGEAELDSDLLQHVQSGRAAFRATDLRDFVPTDRWDVIVFNEVLYYLTCDQAVAEFTRYSRCLTDGGVLVVTMKDDAKSRAIFKSLNRSFAWLDGMLWQRKAFGPDYRLRTNRERPPTLLGIFGLPAKSLEKGDRDTASHRLSRETLATGHQTGR